ncbi:hypothetical protein MRX96_041164 [Rhipicephalus microplus]
MPLACCHQLSLSGIALPRAGEKEEPPSFGYLSLDVLYAAPPCLDTSLLFIRQHGTASDNPAVDKSAQFDGSLDHGAVFSAQRSLTLFAQVSGDRRNPKGHGRQLPSGEINRFLHSVGGVDTSLLSRIRGTYVPVPLHGLAEAVICSDENFSLCI